MKENLTKFQVVNSFFFFTFFTWIFFACYFGIKILVDVSLSGLYIYKHVKSYPANILKRRWSMVISETVHDTKSIWESLESIVRNFDPIRWAFKYWWTKIDSRYTILDPDGPWPWVKIVRPQARRLYQLWFEKKRLAYPWLPWRLVV